MCVLKEDAQEIMLCPLENILILKYYLPGQVTILYVSLPLIKLSLDGLQ